MIFQVGKPRQAHITQNVVYVRGAFTHFKTTTNGIWKAKQTEHVKCFRFLWGITSSETQGQSNGPGEMARRKFYSTRGRAPGYQPGRKKLGASYALVPTLTGPFPNGQRMLAPNWAQKMLCIIVHDHRTASPEFFLCVCTWRLLTWLAHAPKKCTQSGNLKFDRNSVQLKILSTRKLKTFFSMLNYLVLLLIAILHGRNTLQIYVQLQTVDCLSQEGSNRFSIITVLYVSTTLVFITSLFIARVHGVIVPIIYCLVFFSFKNVQLDCSLMPTSLNHL